MDEGTLVSTDVTRGEELTLVLDTLSSSLSPDKTFICAFDLW